MIATAPRAAMVPRETVAAVRPRKPPKRWHLRVDGVHHEGEALAGRQDVAPVAFGGATVRKAAGMQAAQGMNWFEHVHADAEMAATRQPVDHLAAVAGRIDNGTDLPVSLLSPGRVERPRRMS